MKEIKNWDKNTWLSSSAYINIFNSFLLKKKSPNNSKACPFHTELDSVRGFNKSFSSFWLI